MTSISQSQPVSRKIPRLDILLCVGLALLSSGVAYNLQAVLQFTNTNLDTWFDSDSLFILDQITNQKSQHNDTNSRHPIFVLLTFPLVKLQMTVLGIDKANAALSALLLYSSLCVSAMYAALRLMRKPIAVSLVFTGLFMVSSAGLLFLGIHERFVHGGLSILLCIIAFLLYERRAISSHWLTLAAAFSLGVTITNFMIGVAALYLAHGWKRGLQEAVNAFVIIMILSSIMLLGFRSSSTFMDVRTWPFSTTSFAKNPEKLAIAGSLPQKGSAFLFHGMILPEPEIQKKTAPSNIRYLSVQKVGVMHNQTSWYFAVAFWLVILGSGIFNMIRGGSGEKNNLLLGLGAAGQFCLFLVFGAEVILYSMYFMPLMLLIAAQSWREGHSGNLTLLFVFIFFAMVLWNNSRAFFHSVELAKTLI